jgi:hypothetical protein
VGKSAAGYEIFQQVYRSGIKASFMDFDQFGLCYPSPAEAIREAGELDAADFADLCVDTDNHDVAQVARQVRTRAGGWPRLVPAP